MKLLAIETSTDACSVALMNENQMLGRHEIAPRQHAQYLLSWIALLLEEANLTLTQLDAIAYGHGPGSFTGLRIGAGIVQGLAYGASLPVVTLSSLQVLAQSVFHEFSFTHVLVAQDAKMHQVYYGAYCLDEEKLMSPVISDILCDPKGLPIPDLSKAWVIVGDALKTYDGIKRQYSSVITVEDIIYPHATDLAYLAASEFRKGNYKAPENVLPLYLRGKEAWKKS